MMTYYAVFDTNVSILFVIEKRGFSHCTAVRLCV